MLEFNGVEYGSFNEIKENFDLLSAAEVMKLCKCNLSYLRRITNQKNIKTYEVIKKPSNKSCFFYDNSSIEIIKKSHLLKNDVIPAEYIPKQELCNRLNISTAFLTELEAWCYDIKSYAKIFYTNNTGKKYYLYNQDALIFYKSKIDKYLNPNRTQKKISIEKSFENEVKRLSSQKQKFYKHHKIKIDKKILSELLDTSNVYYKKLISIYEHYSNQIVEDVSLYELHHIIPRFYTRNGAYYPELNNMENLIYLPPNIHFLVHFLEYKCSLPIYREKFFGACCLKTVTLDMEKIQEEYITEITKLLIKAFC